MTIWRARTRMGLRAHMFPLWAAITVGVPVYVILASLSYAAAYVSRRTWKQERREFIETQIKERTCNGRAVTTRPPSSTGVRLRGKPTTRRVVQSSSSSSSASSSSSESESAEDEEDEETANESPEEQLKMALATYFATIESHAFQRKEGEDNTTTTARV